MIEVLKEEENKERDVDYFMSVLESESLPFCMHVKSITSMQLPAVQQPLSRASSIVFFTVAVGVIKMAGSPGFHHLFVRISGRFRTSEEMDRCFTHHGH